MRRLGSCLGGVAASSAFAAAKYVSTPVARATPAHTVQSAANALCCAVPRMQRRSEVTIGTAGNFETEVLQSQSALCVVFHVNSRACKAHLAELEELADFTNKESRHNWLRVVSIDADRNSNLASAFSVERRKVPMTFFVVSGTMIDKVSGKSLPSERLQSIVLRFKEYYQKSKGVELEAHGPFNVAKQQDLKVGATTDSLEAQILEQLVGSNRLDASTASGREALATEVMETVDQATRQAAVELDALRASVGVDFKRLDELQLGKQYYSTTQYTASAHLAALRYLLLMRLACGMHFEVEESTGKTAQDVADAMKRALEAFANLKQDFPHAIGHSSVKRIVSIADLRRSWLEAMGLQRRFAGDDTEEAPAVDGIVPPINAVRKAAADVVALADAIDARNSPASVPSELTETLLEDLKGLMAAGRLLRKADAASTGVGAVTTTDVAATQQLTRRALVATLAAYADDPQCDQLRARAASLLY